MFGQAGGGGYQIEHFLDALGVFDPFYASTIAFPESRLEARCCLGKCLSSLKVKLHNPQERLRTRHSTPRPFYRAMRWFALLQDLTFSAALFGHIPTSIFPKLTKSLGRKFRVPDGVLDGAVAQVMLNRAGIYALVGQVKPTGMTKHMGMDREG
jgi:hypothetical protein